MLASFLIQTQNTVRIKDVLEIRLLQVVVISLSSNLFI